MSARQQVVYSSEPEESKTFSQVYYISSANKEFVRDAIDGSIEDLINTMVDVYLGSTKDSDDLMYEVDELVREAVKEIVGDE